MHIVRDAERTIIRGAFKKKKMGKVGILSQPGGRGLTESQLFGKISQNLICLAAVHANANAQSSPKSNINIKFFSSL